MRLIPAREASEIFGMAIAIHNPIARMVLFSGGKDSSVTLDYMWRNHRSEITGALHINTGIGLQSTHDFAKQFCDERGIPFYEITTKEVYEEIVEKHGFPGSGAHMKMYVRLKERPLDAFIAATKRKWKDRIALITGVRAEESRRRMGTCISVDRKGAKVWIAPLIDWSMRDMQAYREKYSVEMSPASSTIHLSAECLCGAFGSPDELDLIETFHPDPSLKRIRALEKKLASEGHRRCRWGVTVPGEESKDNMAPGPMCVGCEMRFPTLEDVL